MRVVVGYTDGHGTTESVTSAATAAVTNVNDAPAVAASGGTTAALEQIALAVDAGVTVADVDNATLASATVAITGGFHGGEDVLAFANNGSTMGNIAGSYAAGTGILTLTSVGAAATLAQWQAALRAVTYTDVSDVPNTVDRTISFVVNDGTLSSVASTKTVSVTAVNDVPVAHDDAFTTLETTALSGGNLFANNGASSDDPDDGSAFSVTAVNGSTANVGHEITLASGGHLTVSANGTFSYDPNHAFDYVPVSSSGASNTPATDQFTYTITGGSAATVTLIIAGVDSDDILQGTAGPDTLFGGIGNDTLVGGVGADTMVGGVGNDGYSVDNAGDAVIENANEGTDTVNATIHYGLGANVENLVLQGSADLQGYGNSQANTITGNVGNNLLDGGAGADVMVGGAGNDTYFVDNAGDAVIESPGCRLGRGACRPRITGCRRMWKRWFCRGVPTCRATATD